MTVAKRLLLDRRRAFFWWSVGISVFVASNAALYPSVRDAPVFKDLMDQIPKNMRELFGLSGVSITSPAGYLNGRQYSLIMPILVLMFGIALAVYATAGTEEDGTMEFTLALPVSRRRLAVERLGAVIALIVGLGLVSAVVQIALAPTVGLLNGLSVADIFVATGAICGLAVFFAALAFAVGCLTGRRSLALAVTAGLGFYGYVFYGVSAVSDRLHALRLLSPWYWFIGQNTLVGGANPFSTVVPIVAVSALVVFAVRHFETRDLR